MRTPPPTVTVLMATYNRAAYLPGALQSVVNQRFADWELLVINDGGRDVRGIVEGFHDERIRYLDREENRGKAACLNLGLELARGRYVAYLDDDDIWYPTHLAALVEALQDGPGGQVAYSDLYEAVCVKDERGGRHPLQKRIRVSRDFNRMFLFHFNHVFHVSLMHTRELALKAGGYDENVRVMIDWNMTRKLCFYTDFLHVPSVTGEYYVPINRSDRLSDLQREDEEGYRQNLRRIRADLPPEPWPMVKKVAVVFPVDEWDDRTDGIVRYFADKLDYPCRIVLVNARSDGDEARRLQALGPLAELGNLRVVDSPAGATAQDAYLAGARSVDADYFYLPSRDLCLDLELRLIRGIGYMDAIGCRGVRWAGEGEGGPGNVMLTREALLERGCSPCREPTSDVQTVPLDWLPAPLKADRLLDYASVCENEGDYVSARKFLDEVEAIRQGGVSRAYLAHLRARVDFGLGNYADAEKMCVRLIAEGYGADNWIRLGQIRQTCGRYGPAAESYRKGLEAIGLTERDLDSSAFPLNTAADFDAFIAVVGMGECCLELDRYDEAARSLRNAAKLRSNSYRPYLAFGRLFLGHGELDTAEEALTLARERDADGKVAAIDAWLAEVHSWRGDVEQAWRCSLRALSKAPDHEQYLQQATRLARASGRVEELAEVYDTFLSHRPGCVAALAGLAELYLELGRRGEAVELARRALLLRPDNQKAQAIVAERAGAPVGGAEGQESRLR